ncbi:hypothetical protein T439DRAFT_333853 [Meredithblackwellia eburnea MCA 4105]
MELHIRILNTTTLDRRSSPSVTRSLIRYCFYTSCIPCAFCVVVLVGALFQNNLKWCDRGVAVLLALSATVTIGLGITLKVRLTDWGPLAITIVGGISQLLLAALCWFGVLWRPKKAEPPKFFEDDSDPDKVPLRGAKKLRQNLPSSSRPGEAAKQRTFFRNEGAEYISSPKNIPNCTIPETPNLTIPTENVSDEQGVNKNVDIDKRR